MKKEWTEWIHSKCIETTNDNMPKVLLVGDSITDGYYNFVSKKLWDICRVDYVATSYAVDSKTYNAVVSNIIKDSNYAVIHFNHGLHGKHMSKSTYLSRIKKLLLPIDKNTELILATTTNVLKDGVNKIEPSWNKKVLERNELIRSFANEIGAKVDDLYPLSVNMDYSHRTSDGFHYDEFGYDLLAEQVSKIIRKIIK